MKKNFFYTHGKEYWRSLDQLADTEEFRKFLHNEFPEGVAELSSKMNRRKFLTLMGASMALAGLTSCRRPVEKIVPYVNAPEQIIPGIPQYYATTMPFSTSSYGLVVESHEGRPTKIEGNELHPSTLGSANSFLQAAILGLYDPDRAQVVKQKGKERKWKDFVAFWQNLHAKYIENKGEGLAIISESFSSPTLYRLKQKFGEQLPKAKWVSYEPISDQNIREGIRISTGEMLVPMHRFDQAKIILAIDADFLLRESESIVNARGFIKGRHVDSKNTEMNRLYAAESNFSITGGMADHRIKIPASHIPALVIALAKELQKQGLVISGMEDLEIPEALQIDDKILRVLASDLLKYKGRGLIVAGRQQPASIHAMIFALNHSLQNNGKTIFYRRPKDEYFDNLAELQALIEEMNSDKIDSLFIIGGNPIYNMPVDMGFKDVIQKVTHTMHCSLYFDETAKQVEWHIPSTHFLETWGDARANDGTASVIQPLIAPLFNGHSEIELVSLIVSGAEASGYNLTRETWAALLPKKDFEKRWRRVLHDGMFKNSRTEFIIPRLRSTSLATHLKENAIPINPLSLENIELTFQISPNVYDGRFANNGWLQELPDTVTKLAWDNAAIISPATASALGVNNEDLIVLNIEGRELPIPVWILPGQADFSISIALGYGRFAAGRIGNGVGFNAYRLRTSTAPYVVTGVSIRKTRDNYKLANTQDHNSMEGRPFIRERGLHEFNKNPDFAQEMVEHPPLISLWDEPSYEQGYQWGMSIDLNACIGCNTCTIACQSENNIPIVGKEQVIEGREMHWIRVDRYFSNTVEAPEMVYQPVTCQHCENAPCEQVCPVAATVHDSEGLNVMTYNRCIGTRYCSNNCPYKVRRFNFFNYTKDLPEIVRMVQNPDVTVRSRGVMEKCTYCLQRLSEAKIKAKNEGKTLRDGDVVTACQQACPTNAITFGDINNPRSQVVKIKKDPRNYEILAELNVQPRTSYLAKLRNPNPELIDT